MESIAAEEISSNPTWVRQVRCPGLITQVLVQMTVDITSTDVDLIQVGCRVPSTRKAVLGSRKNPRHNHMDTEEKGINIHTIIGINEMALWL